MGFSSVNHPAIHWGLAQPMTWWYPPAALAEEAWTFSELLEPLALIPQYIVCYRAPLAKELMG